MISSISFEEASQGLKCFELGAVDYLEKPSSLNLMTKGEEVRMVLKAAASSRVQLPAAKIAQEAIHYRKPADHKEIIAIGASAGGPNAVHAVLQQFPHNSPPVVIVQHLPKMFTSAFAKKLSENCAMKVVEAADGVPLQNGHIYVAPGGFQTKVVQKKDGPYIGVTNDEPMAQHRPSVDYLFSSLASLDESFRISAAILTGMGRDGAEGMRRLWKRGAYTVAQNEETCVVFGMPRAAIEEGAVIDVLPLQEIAGALFKGLNKKNKMSA
jgi:two-component system chemotaxis response regulator CheB